jgi:hypothetical protein
MISGSAFKIDKRLTVISMNTREAIRIFCYIKNVILYPRYIRLVNGCS